MTDQSVVRAGISPALITCAAALAILVACGVHFIGQTALASYGLTALLHGAVYSAAIWHILNRPSRHSDLLLILAVAVVFRIIAIQAPPNLTTDGLRYVWDGRIQWAGFNPFLWVPADPALAHLRDAAIYPEINQKETAVTIYPPMAQILFLVANAISDGLGGIQLVMGICDLIIMAAVIIWLKSAELPPERVLIYAWHPLPIWEFVSMAHIDSAATMWLVLAIVAVVQGRQGWAGGLLAAAVLTKYFPIVLAPALWHRWGWRMPATFVATAMLLYLPYAWHAGVNVIGFLFRHLDNAGYSAGYGFHVVWILRDFGLWAPSGRTYALLAMTLMAAIGAVILLRRRADELRPDHLIILGGAYTLITSPHYAWYFGWLVPLLARYPSPSVLGFTLLAVLLNVKGTVPWPSHTAFYTIIFGGFIVMAVAEVVWRKRSRPPAT